MTTEDSHCVHSSKISVRAMLLMIAVMLTIGVATLGLGTIASSQDDDSSRARGTIVGQVTDPLGSPLEGVTVRTHNGPSAATDIGGTFELTGVEQRKRIILSFGKPGYVSTQAITSLKVKGNREDHDDADEEGDEDDDEATGHKLDRVTVTKTMLPSGATQTLNTATTGTIVDEGFKVTFPAESLNTTGAVEITVSPIDVSTNELKAFPGEFKGEAQDGRRVLIEAHSLMNVSITQDGQPVNLKPGSTATLELLLPTDSQLTLGETVPLWFYSETNGRWIEEGTGTVGISTFNSDRLSIIGQVTHFTWWGAGRPFLFSDLACMRGTVRDSNGSPIEGALVTAIAGNYRLHSFNMTDREGRYEVVLVRDSVALVTAYMPVGGAYHSVSVSFPTPPMDDSGTGSVGCEPIPDITLPPTSCVSGDVRDNFNNPIAGVRVFSNAGTSSTSDANGTFCLGAPGDSSVTVHAPGYESATVTTPDVEGSCVVGGCAIVAIRLAPAPTPTPTPSPTPTPTPTPTPATTSCMTISVTLRSDGSPAGSALVRVFDNLTGNLLATGTADATGKVCFENLPADTDVNVVGSRNRLTGGAFTNTGPQGGSCALSGCLQVSFTLDQGT